MIEDIEQAIVLTYKELLKISPQHELLKYIVKRMGSDDEYRFSNYYLEDFMGEFYGNEPDDGVALDKVYSRYLLKMRRAIVTSKD